MEVFLSPRRDLLTKDLFFCWRVVIDCTVVGEGDTSLGTTQGTHVIK